MRWPWTRSRGPTTSAAGAPTRITALIESLDRAAAVPVRHEVDPSLLRTSDARELRGSPARLRAATGWEPRIPLDETVRDTLEWWREQVRG